MGPPNCRGSRIALVDDAAGGVSIGGMGTGSAVVGAYVLAGELLTEPDDYARAFRRYRSLGMVFKGLISNTDDHPRNHAVLAMDTTWGLSAAYDLTPTNPVGVERRDLALICGNAGRYANASNMRSQCARFLLPLEQATNLIDRMRESVRANWFATSRGEGVTERACGLISGAFAYEGFDLPLQSGRNISFRTTVQRVREIMPPTRQAKGSSVLVPDLGRRTGRSPPPGRDDVANARRCRASAYHPEGQAHSLRRRSKSIARSAL